ncbi:MAG: glycoside hydrolase family 15 protein [Anaerolineae bacterium]
MTSQSAIRDYALLSDGNTAALVHRYGSIDWYCPARFDAPSVFARLLDDSAGYWAIQPTANFEGERHYIEETLVLRTVFSTAGGKAALTDALALELNARGHEIGLRSPHILLRQLTGLEGEVQLSFDLCPRPEYGLGIPLILRRGSGLLIQAGSLELFLLTAHPVTVESGRVSATVTVKAGEHVNFALGYRIHRDSQRAIPVVDVPAEIQNAVDGWQSWAKMHHNYDGLYVEHVRRSALVLQALTFHPTGVIIAAPTTSLPETIGGDRNWDYRYAWLRDLTLTMRALYIATCPDEIEHLFFWVDRALGDVSSPEQPIQIMYGVEGERDLTEHALPHLRGYRGSYPVRVGNDAWFQKQLDVLGEVVDAVYLFRDKLDEMDGGIKRLVVNLANRAAASWHEPDSGMWEARDQERHYLTSKVMCWVALDRAIKLAPQLGDGFDLRKWETARDEIRQAVLEKGWQEDVQAYTGAFGSDHLDASVLLLPLVDFLPADDPRMKATIHTIARDLSHNGQVYRWKGEENTFLLCTYWLVECLVLLGETERARQLFEETTAYANDVGLLAEMNDPVTGALIGNFPQAFSHIGLINAAWRLSQAAHPAEIGR